MVTMSILASNSKCKVKQDLRFCLACFIIASFVAAGVKMGIRRAVGFNAINVPAT